MVDKAGFRPTTILPRDLTIEHLAKAIDYIERELSELVEIYHEQANVFSALVGIFGTRALDQFSPYEKHRHSHTAQQRFPDLCHRRGRKPLQATSCLESKGSKRPWEVQSHYDHPGWYIIWRYLVDDTQSVEAGKTVVIWRVDVVFIDKSDWKYETSKAGVQGGGRTHTFGLRRAGTKLKDCIAYQHPRIHLRAGKPIPAGD